MTTTLLESLSNEELSELVAEHVMKWKRDQVASGQFYWESTDGPTSYRVMASDHYTYPMPDVWNPAASIADAMENILPVVRGWTRARQFVFLETLWHEAGKVMHQEGQIGRDWMVLYLEPRHICIAALRAVGCEEED